MPDELSSNGIAVGVKTHVVQKRGGENFVFRRNRYPRPAYAARHTISPYFHYADWTAHRAGLSVPVDSFGAHVLTIRRRLYGAALMSGTLLLGGTGASADGIRTAGEILRIALPAAAGGLSLYKDDYDGVLQLGVSEAGSYGTSLLLQSVIKERRPDGSNMRSFPSDSTAVAFSAAAFLEKRYGWDYGLPAYALAAFVGYSRVEADKHHWGDVVAGAAIGWGFSALTTVRYYKNIRVTAQAGYADTPLGGALRLVW
jgi:hypothetical protein